MKASQLLVDRFKAHIAPLDTAERRAAYSAKGLSDRRYRWDLAWRAGSCVSDAYVAGLNDAHIDTVLRSIVAPL